MVLIVVVGFEKLLKFTHCSLGECPYNVKNTGSRHKADKKNEVNFSSDPSQPKDSADDASPEADAIDEIDPKWRDVVLVVHYITH